jgi:predicted nucleic acid-binding protein
MRPPACTIDASSLIALDHLDLLPQLSLLFSRVLLPKAVRTELYRRRRTKDRLRALLGSFAFIVRCDNYDQGAVDILLAERGIRGGEDRGEAEAVVQASETGASVIGDDPWGRTLAERFARDFHGAVWVLKRFYELGLASSALTRSHFVALSRRGIRLPWPVVNDFLSEIGEQPILNLDDT